MQKKCIIKRQFLKTLASLSCNKKRALPKEKDQSDYFSNGNFWQACTSQLGLPSSVQHQLQGRRNRQDQPTQFLHLQGVPHLHGFHYLGFWLMYVQVGDFRVSRGISTVPLTQISCNTVFFKSQNARKVGTLCRSQKYSIRNDFIPLI